jgi:predicted AAA+ superfamily ATPase
LNAITFKFSDDYGKLLENLCYLEFRRKGYSIYYFKDNKECDFVLEKNNKILPVQVSYNLSDLETRERELAGLVYCCQKLSLKKGVILSLSELKEQMINGIKVKFIPVIPFFLNDVTLE